jgi:hypothetical protein
MKLMITTFVLFILTAIAALTVGHYAEKHVRNMKSMQRELDHYHSTYKIRQGGTSLWSGSKGEMLNYFLESFDGGLNWYVIRTEGNNRYVQGNVENVYPGLMRHLQAMDDLTRRVEANGPLDLGKSSDVKFLKNVGFTVTPSTN